MPDREKLKEFYLEIRECKRCALGDTRTNFVFGSGSAEARLMFVGEAPGRQEDLRGYPFVGAAGRLLEHLLETIGLTRKDVFIANVLKCRPPNNRDPLADEIALCEQYLFRQIELIEPAVVCTLGNFSTKLLLEEERGITQLRGQVFERPGYVIVPTYHPAAALYTPALQKKLEDDFQVLARALAKDDTGAPVSEPAPAEADRSQLNLFGE